MEIHVLTLLIFIEVGVFSVEIFPPVQEIVIKENVGAVSLPCSYRTGSGFRPDSVRWTLGDHNGRLVFSADKFSNGVAGGLFSGRVTLGNGADLIIRDPSVSDSATYTCSVKVPTDSTPMASGEVILLVTECAEPDTVAVAVCVTLDIILIASAILWFVLNTRARIIQVKLYRRIIRLVAAGSVLCCTASAIVLIVYVSKECVQGLYRLRVAGILFCVLGMLLGILCWLLTARKLRASTGHRSSDYDRRDGDMESGKAETQNSPMSNDKAMLGHPRMSSGTASPTDRSNQGEFFVDNDKAMYDDVVKILPNQSSGQKLRRFEELKAREHLPSQTDRYLTEPMNIIDYNMPGSSPLSNGPDEVFYPPRKPTTFNRPDREDGKAPTPPKSEQYKPAPVPAPRRSAENSKQPVKSPQTTDPQNVKIQNEPRVPPQLSLPPTRHQVRLRDNSPMKKARSEEILKSGLSLPNLNVERRSLPLSIEEKIDQDIFLEDCKKTADYFIETSAYRIFEEQLNNKDTKGVTLTGLPGTGKTVTAMYTAWKLHTKSGFLPLKVSTISEIERIYIEGLKLVFVVDDPFGKLCTSSELQEYWIQSAKRLQTCLSTDNVKVIATVRSDIWATCRFSVMRYPPFSSPVELSGNFTVSERSAMLSGHLMLAGVNTNDDVWQENIANIAKRGYTPDFPLCCQLVRKSESFRKAASPLFQKPTAMMRKDMRLLRKDDPASFCVLALILVHGCKLSRTVLSRPLDDLPLSEREKIESLWQAVRKKSTIAPPSPKEFQEKVDALCKIYIEKAETSLEFSLTSFADVTLLELAAVSVDLLFKWCHPDVISGKLVPEGCSLPDLQTSETLVNISSQHWPQFARVLTNELLDGNIKAVMDNPAWGWDEFVVAWNEHVVTDSIRNKLLSVSGTCSQGEIVHRAAHQGLVSVLHVLLQSVILDKNGIRVRNEYGQSLLHSAAIGGQYRATEYLLEKGCPVDAVNDAGESPLYVAALYGHAKLVELLLKNNANPDLPNKLGLRPLHAAVFGERAEVVSLLSTHVSKESLGGCSRSRIGITSFRDKFMSTLKHSGLHEAARANDLVRIHHLLDNAFDKNKENKYGWSPLHITVMLGHVEAAALLLTRGANPNTLTPQGTAPLDEACSTFNDPLVALLLSFDTKRSSCV